MLNVGLGHSYTAARNPSTTTIPTISTTPKPSDTSTDLTPAQVAGIVISSVTAALAVAAFVYTVRRRRRGSDNGSHEMDNLAATDNVNVDQDRQGVS